MVSFGAAFLVPVMLPAQGRSNRLSSAVDAQEVRHRGSEYIGRAPWMDDVVKTVTPDYPYDYRRRHVTGSGLFRVTLNVNTGSVIEVAALKSTRVSMLDSCAIKALRQWRWKAGRWKEIDVPITFALSRDKAGMYIGSTRVPASR
jgi:TonB family protein